jgi:hypothetical protein
LVTAVTVFSLCSRANWKVTNHHLGAPGFLFPDFF